MSPLDGPAMPLPKTAQTVRPATNTPRKLRQKASKARWEQIVAAKDGPCRVCGGPRGSFHHVVPRGGWGGADTESNIVPLCGHGTSGCHGLIEHRDETAMRLLVASLTDNEYAYAVERAGESFLERRYGIRFTTIGGN